MIENRGEMSFESANDSNVPIDIQIHQIEEKHLGVGYGTCDKITPDDVGKFYIMANNYMPRCARLAEDSPFFAVADTKEEIAEIVQKYILPLYLTAVAVLNKMIETGTGTLYYWNNDNE